MALGLFFLLLRLPHAGVNREKSVENGEEMKKKFKVLLLLLPFRVSSLNHLIVIS